MIIAIDGPAAAGKGTLARRLAQELGYAYLDTGLLYRAVGMGVRRAGGDPDNRDDAAMAAQRVTANCLSDPALRTDEAGQMASRVAAIAPVRAALLEFQREFARTPPQGAPGAVLDGRDIGTVVCPNAARKLFVTGRVEVRAARRVKELREAGETVIEEQVLTDMRERDERDTRRSAAPLVPAKDAFVLDTSDMDAEAAFQAALRYVRSAIG